MSTIVTVCTYLLRMSSGTLYPLTNEAPNVPLGLHISIGQSALPKDAASPKLSAVSTASQRACGPVQLVFFTLDLSCQYYRYPAVSS